MTERSTPRPETLLQHAAFVRAVARGVLRSDDFVDDVEQETWIAALQGADRRKGPLRSWLGGVARRRAADHIRSEVARRRRESSAARFDTDPSASDVAVRAEMGRRVAGAVAALEEPYRTAVLLRYFDDLPPRKIAAQLGAHLIKVKPPSVVVQSR